MKIKQVVFSDFYREATNKNQIYLHHTAGTGIAENVFGNWQQDKIGRIGTCIAIGRDGTIAQGFGSDYWAYHLGLTNAPFRAAGLSFIPLDKCSIGIEIVNWGWLTKKGEKFYSYVGTEIPKDQVCELTKPYKGYKYWQNYTDEQIASVVELLKLWKEKYKIDLTYNEDIWQVCHRALKGENGVYTHNSVRADKSDVYPCPKLIEALKGLK
jgi:N-acetyl-anhydromuramyl-L-alanine amidase AmpD